MDITEIQDKLSQNYFAFQALANEYAEKGKGNIFQEKLRSLREKQGFYLKKLKQYGEGDKLVLIRLKANILMKDNLKQPRDFMVFLSGITEYKNIQEIIKDQMSMNSLLSDPEIYSIEFLEWKKFYKG